MDSHLFYCGIMAGSAGHEVFNSKEAGDSPSASAPDEMVVSREKQNLSLTRSVVLPLPYGSLKLGLQ